jgi:hypothetical protein
VSWPSLASLNPQAWRSIMEIAAAEDFKDLRAIARAHLEKAR